MASVELVVNGKEITNNEFVESMIAAVAKGVADSLTKGEGYETAEFVIDGSNVEIKVDCRPVEVNAFVSDMVRSIILGALKPLKGFGEIERVELKVAF